MNERNKLSKIHAKERDAPVTRKARARAGVGGCGTLEGEGEGGRDMTWVARRDRDETRRARQDETSVGQTRQGRGGIRELHKVGQPRGEREGRTRG